MRVQRTTVIKGSPFGRLLLALVTGFALLSLAFSSGFAVASFKPRPFHVDTPIASSAASEPLDVYREAWDLIASDFYGSLPPNRVRVYGAIRGLLGSLGDPYTVLVEPIARQFEQDDLRGSYGGIGVSLSRNTDGLVVISPYRDSPAVRSGVLEGDILLSVDDVLILPEHDISQDVEALLRGEVGTDVSLAILRAGQTILFVITRQAIDIPSVTWQTLDQAPTVGYLRIIAFTDRTGAELTRGLDEILSGQIDGLILDLRDNGGGLLQAAVDVADRFLDGGTVLYEQRVNQEDRVYTATPGGAALELDLVVLVNHGTASAAEIVAGAVQDRGRGILLGEPTFGKGSVQLIFALSDGSSLHVTAARWHTPDHHQLDGTGLIPDLFVEADASGTLDLQLEDAIDYILSAKE